MKKKNTNTQIVVAKKSDNGFKGIVECVVPKPSKAHILQAAAQALWEKQKAKQQEAHDKLVKAWDEARLIAKKYLAENPPELAIGIGSFSWLNGKTSAEFNVRFEISLSSVSIPINADVKKALEKVTKLKHELDSLPCKSVKNICTELRQRSGTGDATVTAMLSDPDMKEKLLKLGERLLNKITTDEKSSAIPA